MEEAGLLETLTAAVGSAIGPTDWFTVDQRGIDAFSEAIGSADATHSRRGASFVRPGCRVRLSGTVADVESSKAAFVAHFEVAIEIEGADKPACVGRVLMRYAPSKSNG